MSVLNSGLSLYRKTIKRFRPLHSALHWLVSHSVIPVLEAARGFRTIPDDPFWFRLELLTGRHEAETVQLVKQLAQPGMTILDIGGHVGYYALLASELVGERGRVVSFEPHPRTFAVLQQNVSKLGNVQAEQLALAESEGTAELYDYLMMSASGSLHYDEAMLDLQKSQVSDSDIAPRIATDFPVQTYNVRTVPVDRYVEEAGITQVDLVKMDIEGAEIGALRGMRQTISRSPNLKLIMEYNPQALRSFGHDPAAAIAEVRAMGFTSLQLIEDDGGLTDLGDDSHKLDELTQRLNQNMGVVNLLLTR